MVPFTPWLKSTLITTAIAVLFILIPLTPLNWVGGLILLTLLPGLQWIRWLGLYQSWRTPETILVSLALGMVTTPIIIYWAGLLLGYSWLIVLLIMMLYIIGVAVLAGSTPPTLPTTPTSNQSNYWFIPLGLSLITALGVFLAYFELATPDGYYPVQMEDWQKHYGVAFALRYTGIAPTSFFFYGMFPDETLIYYYFLHLNGATLDILQTNSHLHYAFVTFIVLASLMFSSMVYFLGRRMFAHPLAATWAVPFATVISGLDVIPILQRTLSKYRQNFPEGAIPWEVYLPREHIDNWISALSLRMNGFYAHHVWVPQHLTGLTIICLGCYLYLTVTERRKLLAIYPLLLFALLGHSTWIAVVVALCLGLFALWQIFVTYHQQDEASKTSLTPGQLFLNYALIALLAIVIASPFILPLLGENAPKSGIAFEIPKLDSWWMFRPIQAIVGSTIWAKLLDLPLHFFIEHGALLVAGLIGLILFWRAEWQRSENLPDGKATPYALLPFLSLLLAVGILIVTTAASGRGWADIGLVQNNDLGLRAMMPGQLVLALFAGYFMSQLGLVIQSRGIKGVVIIGLSGLIIVGVMSSMWEFVSMGVAKYWDKPKLSATVYQTLQDMPTVTPTIDEKPFPVVQHRLHRDVSRFQLSLGNRPIGFATGEAIVFHRHVDELALAHELSQQAFDNGLPVWSYQMFNNLGANYIFVGPAERETIRHPEKYNHSQYFQLVHDNDQFQLYEIQSPSYGEAQAKFDNGAIIFEGYFFDQAPRYPGDLNSSEAEGIGFVTAWRLTQTVDKNYTMFVHLVDEQENLIAQADHQLWAWDVKTEGPTSSWTVNISHLDIYPIPADILANQSSYTIRLGLWLPDTGEQFPVESLKLPTDSAGRLMIGQIDQN